MSPDSLKQSIAANCQEWGVGAINIDATRIPYEDADDLKTYVNNIAGPLERSTAKEGSGINMFEGQVGYKVQKGKVLRPGEQGDGTEITANEQGRFPSNVLGDIAEEYQKYFYCPKVSRQERHMGFELPPAMFGNVQGCYDENGERFAVGFDNRSEGKIKKKKHDPLGHIATNPEGMWDDGVQFQERKQQHANVGNNHPTVKPIELMKYLIKLITPPGGVVLDPFNGSGSTGVAAVELGFDYIGCELDPKYVEISIKRIEAWRNRGCDADVFDSLFTFGD
jgi:site-specific DNA-methyltransferase (adenine-specific)